METSEIESHIKALAEWAKQDKRRVAVVTCGEITEDGSSSVTVLQGRADRIARILYGSYKVNPDMNHIYDILVKLINSPILAQAFCNEVSRNRDEPDKEPEKRDDVFSRIIKEFGDILGKK